MERYTRADIQAFVRSKIGRDNLNHLAHYVHLASPKLWGESRPDNFETIATEIALFKDLKAVGYTRLAVMLRRWLPTNHNSLQHNQKVLRRIFKRWAASQIKLGTLEERLAAARRLKLKNPVEGVTLWIDSTDIATEGRRSVSKKSEWWSFKCNRPGVRYMVLMDARRRVRQIWGGYSPKIYDGHFLELKQDWFVANVGDDIIVGDNHFSWGRDNQDKFPKLHANFPDPLLGVAADDDDVMSGMSELTKEKKRYNAAVAHARARVESPFGEIKTRWACLQFAFRESREQLDCVVWLALAIHNAKL